MIALLACTPATVPSPTVALDSSVEDVPGVEQTWDPAVLPDGMPRVEIRIEPDAMARLDADPHLADDEVGVFVDEHDITHEVELNYRGAYQLRNVMSAYDLRNWKVKFPSGDSYLGHREWNFNYEPHFRQKLAYDLFRFAGVRVPDAQHVRVVVNGVEQGMYLRYQDPDDKAWLDDAFGDDEGDLYKAATDLPGVPQCFADLTVLGDTDADYVCHYQKKTNHKVAPGDYAVLRSFVDGLDTSDTDWFEDHIDVDAFLSFLVVSNFISNWDSYPQRPKNYWLYQGPQRMVFIPWDLDGTFNPSSDATYNQMGTTASVMFELLADDYDPPHADEGNDRPLVHRLLRDPAVQDRYLARYAEVVRDLANPDYLVARQQALGDIVEPYLSAADAGRVDAAVRSLDAFVQARHEVVVAELDELR